MRQAGITSALLLALMTPGTAVGDGGDWFPFVLPWDDRGPGITDVSALNPAPAGAGGFLAARDGRFVDEKGNRVRLLGVNLCFGAVFPEKADADKVAARLRKFGVNAVRLHSFDYYPAPRGVFDATAKDGRRLDPKQLDRLDYLVSRLKASGIYVNINLHVARAFPGAESLPRTGNVAAYFDPKLIALQKEYARDLLGRLNPHTKVRYADEPAVAAVELTNENTLLGAAWGDALDKLPRPQRDELTRQWNRWLADRHTTTARLKVAWKVSDDPSPNLIRNGDFGQGAAGWKLDAQRETVAALAGAAAPPEVPGRAVQVVVKKPGKEAWQIQLQQPGLDLKDGEPYTLTFRARASERRPLRVTASLDVADWRNVGLNSTVTVDPQWRPFRVVFTPSQTKPGRCRLAFLVGQAAGTVELAGVTLRRGADEPWPAGASLEAGTVPPGRPAPTPAGEEWLAFLMDVEARYLQTMRDFLRNELGVKAPVVCSQASYGGLGGAYRERRSDFADMHAYWQHPTFPKRAWDPAEWRVGGAAMTREAGGGTFATLPRYRIAELPFTVSEYNHCAPNDHQAECLPLLAALAARQDWDGFYLFDYNGGMPWAGDSIRGFFSIDTNPAKMALLPAAAALFLRGDVPPAKGEARLEIPEGSVAELLARRGHDLRPVWDAAGCKWDEALNRRLSVAFLAGKKGTPAVRRDGPGEAGPIRWEGRGTDRALFTVDTPRSKAVVGHVGGQVVDLTGLKIVGKSPVFATVALTALDGEPADRSRSLLLTAVARVENAGMNWNKERTSVGKEWGSGPTRAEGVSAAVTVQTGAKAAQVWSLDGAGRRRARLDSTLTGGRLTFVIGPTHQTLWYEIQTND